MFHLIAKIVTYNISATNVILYRVVRLMPYHQAIILNYKQHIWPYPSQ